MAARLAHHNVRRMHQSLHHFVADAPWSDEEMLAQVRQQVLPTMQKHGPVVAWMVDDTAFPKQGNLFGGSRTPVRWPNRQTGRIAKQRELIGEHLECEFAHCLAAVPAGSVV